MIRQIEAQAIELVEHWTPIKLFVKGVPARTSVAVGELAIAALRDGDRYLYHRAEILANLRNSKYRRENMGTPDSVKHQLLSGFYQTTWKPASYDWEALVMLFAAEYKEETSLKANLGKVKHGLKVNLNL